MSRDTMTAERPQIADAPTLAPKSNVVPYTAPAVAKPYPPDLLKRVFAIKRGIGNIEKTGWNDFHKFSYRKWEDVLDRLSPLMSEHGVLIVPSEISRSLIEDESNQARNDMLVGISYEFTIISEDGDEWPSRPRLSAFARVRDGKGVHDDKAASKCLTQADKEFLIHFFKIPVTGQPESDADGTEVAQQQKAELPKPPKPGSPEAKALDGPRAITEGTDAATWGDAFIKAIEKAPAAEMPQWIEANKLRLEKLKAYPEVDAKVQAAIKARVPAPPKPPRPGAQPTATAAPAVPAMPDPAMDAAGWLKWLTDKLAGFDNIDDGSTFWSDRVEALDLSFETQEEAMGIWRQFERRFED